LVVYFWTWLPSNLVTIAKSVHWLRRDPALRLHGYESSVPVRIGSNVWIGGGAIVLPGVSIGDDAIVGAGSVVTRDVPPGTTVVGNPARVSKS
jgi:maltose O-acetyltransferase